MNDLRVTTVQADLAWEDPVANKSHFEKALQLKPGETDLVILPEMFTTGFTMNAKKLYEYMDGPTLNWMADLAKSLNACVTGSIIIKEEDKFFNRLLWITPEGDIQYYDKRHLFSMAGEGIHYTAGKERLLVDLKGWKICPLICYDLRFPVFSRNRGDYDLLIFVANWPDKRNYAWKTLLQARAIENQCYVIGVNRVGTDGNQHDYSGDTMVVGPAYTQVLYHCANKEEIRTHMLSGNTLKAIREELPFLKDRDTFSIP